MIQTQTTNYYKGSEHPVLTYTFRRESGRWYIELPEYLAQGWSKEDLAMIEGTHKLLSIIANGRNKVIMRLSKDHFEGADVLELQEHCEAPRGGAIYLMNRCRGRLLNSLIWICDIALFVFGDMPDRIYFQRVDIR